MCSATGSPAVRRCSVPTVNLLYRSNEHEKIIGLTASDDESTGVGGFSKNSIGDRFTGGKAALQLEPQTKAGKPTSGNHLRGEMLMDSTGVLFVCTAPGAPGTWKKVVVQ